MQIRIFIGKKIIACRHKQGVTQDELAQYLGVTKASVSKWETFVSYPDITLLPKIASYFGITIDALMSYEPNLTKEQVRKITRYLSQTFQTESFTQARNTCYEMTQKYYSCFPLLFQIGNVYFCNITKASNMEEIRLLLEDAITLFARIQKCAEDIDLIKQARSMEAMCLLYSDRAGDVLELLGEPDLSFTSEEPIFIAAYCRCGEIEKAKGLLQAGLYMHIVVMMNLLVKSIGMDNSVQQIDETLNKGLALIKAFELETLHPAIIFPFYLAAAQRYAKLEDTNKTLALLQKYTTLAVSDIYPLKLQGNAYFDHLDAWIDENLILGQMLISGGQEVKESIADAVLKNPVFVQWKEDDRFRNIFQNLKMLKEGIKHDS